MTAKLVSRPGLESFIYRLFYLVQDWISLFATKNHERNCNSTKTENVCSLFVLLRLLTEVVSVVNTFFPFFFDSCWRRQDKLGLWREGITVLVFVGDVNKSEIKNFCLRWSSPMFQRNLIVHSYDHNLFLWTRKCVEWQWIHNFNCLRSQEFYKDHFSPDTLTFCWVFLLGFQLVEWSTKSIDDYWNCKFRFLVHMYQRI